MKGFFEITISGKEKMVLSRKEIRALIDELASHDGIRSDMVETVMRSGYRKGRTYNSHDYIMKLLSENEKDFATKKQLFEYVAVKAGISIKAVEKHYYQ